MRYTSNRDRDRESKRKNERRNDNKREEEWERQNMYNRKCSFLFIYRMFGWFRYNIQTIHSCSISLYFSRFFLLHSIKHINIYVNLTWVFELLSLVHELDSIERKKSNEELKKLIKKNFQFEPLSMHWHCEMVHSIQFHQAKQASYTCSKFRI